MSVTSVDKNIWANLLTEVQSQSRQRLPSGKSLLILGDEEVGKTSLIAKIKKDTEITKGYALEYISMDVKDEEREDFTRLGIWIGDSRCYQQNDSQGNAIAKSDVLPTLLKYALSAKNFSDTLLVISVSMSKPWTIIESLNKWVTLIKRHINSLIDIPTPYNSPNKHHPQGGRVDGSQEKGSSEHGIQHMYAKDLEIFKENLIKRYLGYTDKDNKLMGSEKLDSQSSGIGDGLGSDLNLVSLPSAYVLPMMLQDENILTDNLGIPMVVVVTKTDMIPELEKEYDFRNEHFDFIQQHIRKFCLAYGAGLVYTSCKENKNCDLLRQYVLHLQYGFPFKTGPKIVDNDSIFIPIGWDSTKKIAILNEGLSSLNPDDQFEDVLGRPPIKKETAKAPDVLAEDEQIFLSRMQMLLSQPIKSKNEMMVNRSPIAVQKNLDRSGRLTSYQNPSKLSSGTAIDKPLSKMVLLNNTIASSGVSVANAATSINPKTPDTASTNSERILTVFFNSLLHKGKTSGSTSGSPLNKTPNYPNSDKKEPNPNAPPLDDQSDSGNVDLFGGDSVDTKDLTVNEFTSFEGNGSGLDDSQGVMDEHCLSPNNAMTTPTHNMSLNEVAAELNRLASSTPLGQNSEQLDRDTSIASENEDYKVDERNDENDPLTFLKPPGTS